MRLGEMLLRDGRLTQAQLDEAIALQSRSGGRLGTVLFELGLIDLDALTVYLGLELGIPIASGAMLERAKRAAVRLLTAEQAYKHKCVPLIVQDRQLIAAVDEPHDLDTLDALTRITGYRIIPRVAAEVRIYFYIERYYGVARPSRFIRFGDLPRGDQPPSDALPAPPLPGLPPMAPKPIAAPRPAPPLRFARSQSAPPVGPREPEPREAPEMIALEANDMLEEISLDEAATAEAAAPRATPQGAPSEKIPAVEAWLPMSLDGALSAIAAAGDRSAVADAIMGFAAGLFDVAALFITRDNFALGWKAFGDNVDPRRVECALIPLEAPSIFQQAAASANGRFHGPPPPSTVGSYWFKLLRQAEPEAATVAVVTIKKRVVNVLYGHRVGRPPLGEAELADLDRITQAAAAAYARLIAGAKVRST